VQVRKRNGNLVEFEYTKIKNAIIKAMATTDNIEEDKAEKIAKTIEKNFKDKEEIHINEIQDMVELELMKVRPDVAKLYILYRDKKDAIRNKKTDRNLLTDEFLSTYKHRESPMGPLGSFVYYRTYSKWLPQEKRREDWWETIARAVEYNCNLLPGTTKEEAEQLYDNMFNLRQFLSGRTMWAGGTKASTLYPLSNFNCSFVAMDNISKFYDVNYMLMVGAGVGFSVEKKYVNQLPKFRTDINLVIEQYKGKDKRVDGTSLDFMANDVLVMSIGDSKEGWSEAVYQFMRIHTHNSFKTVKYLIINLDNIRPQGERLKTFGGYAPGHTGLVNLFNKLAETIQRSKREQLTNNVKIKLRPVDILDFNNIIAENIVSGGVRRSAQIGLLDSDDVESINAKEKLYYQDENGQWVANTEILHRAMSNNSIMYWEKPTREQWADHFKKMRYTGEPGFINAVEAKRRNPYFKGVNPCAEILLDNAQVCNLTEINVMAFVKDGKLDKEHLLQAQRLSARAGYRMTMPELELHHWNAQQERDRLVGTSLTGYQDAMNAVGYNKKQQAQLLKELKEASINGVNGYAISVGKNKPLLVNTVKPSGTISQLPTVSSGLHFSHSPYYVRRVRISVHDPLLKVCEELGYPIYNEVGQTDDNVTTKVIEFPVKAPEGKTKYDVSAIEQLEVYKMFMENYVDHNASITISVKEDEWDKVEQWVYDNWDTCVGLSFLSLDDNFYQLAPYEKITAEEYNKRKEEMKPFKPYLLSKYEEGEDFEIEESECEDGICPVR
jgi:ribonucleoside-diphosphate reductase alpha chain/ribonucleoside-triphosphate reductase